MKPGKGPAWMSPAYALVMGLFFAFLQTGYFFELQLRMTAAYPTFLTITLAWLLGSALGVWLGGRETDDRSQSAGPGGGSAGRAQGSGRGEGGGKGRRGSAEGGSGALGRVLWAAGSLGAYYSALFLLRMFPYRTGWLPVLGILIAVSGVQAGHFFGSGRSLFKSVGPLFFWENNGFVLGWIAAFAGYVSFGSVFYWVAPALAGLVGVVLREGGDASS